MRKVLKVLFGGLNRRTKTKSSLSLFCLWFFFCRAFFFVRFVRSANAFAMVRYILLHSSNNAKSFLETHIWKLQNHTHFSLIEEKDKKLRVAVILIVVVIVGTTTTRALPVLVGMTKSQRQKERERCRQHWTMFPRRRVLCLLRMKKKKKEEDKVVVIIMRTTVCVMIARERRKRVLGLPSENDRR